MPEGEFLLIKKKHLCNTPGITQMRVSDYWLNKEITTFGTIWKCSCGQNYMLDGYRGMKFWSKVSERKAKKLIKRG
jgi:hypothetical protein